MARHPASATPLTLLDPAAVRRLSASSRPTLQALPPAACPSLERFGAAAGDDAAFDGRETYTVGRKPSCNLVLSDLRERLHHAQAGGGRIAVTDSSSNGTYLNGVMLPKGESRVLEHGDVTSLVVSLKIPPTNLKPEKRGGVVAAFVCHDDDRPPPPPPKWTPPTNYCRRRPPPRRRPPSPEPPPPRRAAAAPAAAAEFAFDEASGKPAAVGLRAAPRGRRAGKAGVRRRLVEGGRGRQSPRQSLRPRRPAAAAAAGGAQGQGAGGGAGGEQRRQAAAAGGERRAAGRRARPAAAPAKAPKQPKAAKQPAAAPAPSAPPAERRRPRRRPRARARAREAGLAAVDEDAPLESAAPRPTMPAKPLTKTSMADVYEFMFARTRPTRSEARSGM